VSSSRNNPDYTGVTETPGTLISPVAISMGLSRYEVVRKLAVGRRVLEVACGSGQGLRYVGHNAEWIVGGDITAGLLVRAHAHYQGAMPLVQFDAHDLPFADSSFDIVQIHEAIYYMAEPRRVFDECKRVLRVNGILVLSTINPDWADFNPSPHATGYFTATSLKKTLLESFRSVEIMFGFPISSATVRGRVFSVIKRIAVGLKLIPKTMSGKTILKRIVFGPLRAVPAEFTPDCAPIDVPAVAPIHHSTQFRIIYAVARP
jgi:SAM-dependent methyltransferase